MTKYIKLLPCFRLIVRDHKIVGWYNPRLHRVLD